ncbi:helix-turn-helix domain-containing protein [Paraburkholderia solitsugae]|uniref:helix-turn-helix domain-containing protein n=1 Tax=Paraburkholderia solitsugae TaxID=2675748 RepID=UPI0038B3DAA8
MCGLSVEHFSHALKKRIGQSPYPFLIGQRQRRAKTLMLTANPSLAEIALASSFSAPPHLSRRFIAVQGVSPGLWRRFNG